MSYNIAALPEDVQKLIEVEKQAAYLIWQMREFKISRQDVIDVIAESDNKQALKVALNKYQGMK